MHGHSYMAYNCVFLLLLYAPLIMLFTPSSVLWILSQELRKERGIKLWFPTKVNIQLQDLSVYPALMLTQNTLVITFHGD